jgi:hypothetical protein
VKTKTDKNDSIKEFYAEFLRLPNPSARRASRNSDGKPNMPYATKQEFCDYWHIDRVTIWRWEQDPEFMRRVHNDVLGIISVDDAQKIIQALKIRAFDGKVDAAKFLLEWAGITGAKASKPLGPSIEEEEHVVSKMTDEELRILVAEEDFAELSDVSGETDDEDCDS